MFLNKIVDKVNQYREIAKQESKNWGIPQGIILSVIAQESGGNPKAVSADGYDYGLMQIRSAPNCDTAREIAKELGMDYFVPGMDLFRADVNIRFGTYYLGKLKKMCDKAKDKEYNYLAAYNGGFGNRGRPKPQQYRLKVLKWYFEHFNLECVSIEDELKKALNKIKLNLKEIKVRLPDDLK